MKQYSPIVLASDLGSEAESEPSAATPLLSDRPTAHDHRPHSRDHSSTVPEIHHHHKTHPKFFFVVVIIIASLFFISIGDYMNRAPWTRILEDIVCRQYYHRTVPNEFENPFDPIPEDRCKVPDVQARVAMLRGWDQTFSCIPSILTAVPYGIIADKYGRKIVLVMCLFGITLAVAWTELVGYFSHFFAIEWLWAGNVFLFIGGGSSVARSMYFTILADVASEDKRYEDFLPSHEFRADYLQSSHFLPVHGCGLDCNRGRHPSFLATIEEKHVRTYECERWFSTFRNSHRALRSGDFESITGARSCRGGVQQRRRRWRRE